MPSSSKSSSQASRLGSLIGRIIPDDPIFKLNLRVNHTIKINTDFIPRQAELLAEHHLTSQLGGGRKGPLLLRGRHQARGLAWREGQKLRSST